MGCHTWYRKLVTNNQEQIIKKVKDIIAVSNHYFWYEFTDLKDLFDSEEEWIVEITDHVYNNLDGLLRVNGVFGIYESASDFQTDEPRVGGYPDTIIKSADEMFKAMETGLTNVKNKHCNFYWNKDREDYIRNNIKEFFEHHPDGIIEFG